jgi:hypothetical protein
LVVVAIIALLISILLPSLRAAREEAQIVVCGANSKQIATMMSLYQADYKGRVPVMLGYYVGSDANSVVNGQDTIPARTLLLSVALRGYAQDRRKLGGQFDPQKHWISDYWDDNSLHRQYENKMLPPFFMCPFTREKGRGYEDMGTIKVTGPGGTEKYRTWVYTGRHESYQTWLWPYSCIRGEEPGDPKASGDTGSKIRTTHVQDLRPKYSALTWNMLKPSPSSVHFGYNFNSLELKNAHRDWTFDGRDRLLKSAGLSQLTVLHCAQGQMMNYDFLKSSGGYDWSYTNIGSHRRSGSGGTNVIFADTHVEWVKGTQVGWP